MSVQITKPLSRRKLQSVKDDLTRKGVVWREVRSRLKGRETYALWRDDVVALPFNPLQPKWKKYYYLEELDNGQLGNSRT